MKTNTREKYFLSQLYAHNCQLPPSDDYQHVRLLRKSKNFFLISEKSLESYLKVKGLSGIYYEKRRQVRMTKIIIHPFSQFRKMWMILMSFVLLLAFIAFPFFAAFHGPIYAKQLLYFNNSFVTFWIILYFVLVVQLACVVDVVVNFFTGYVTETPEEMVIEPLLITRSYIFKYFSFDLISSFPLDIFLVTILGVQKYSELESSYALALAIRPFLKFFRLYTFYKYCHVFVSLFSSSEAAFNAFCVTIFFFLFIHWSTCILVLFSQFMYYNRLFEDIEPSGNSSWIFESRLYERNIFSMYVCAWYRSVCCITRLGFERFSTHTIEDKIISIVLGIFGGSYLLILLVVFLQVTSAVARPKMAFAEIMDQVKEYMEFKNFPMDLKKKVTEYYLCLYQKHYVDEGTILKLASDNLRKEILLRIYQRLIENVNIFSGLSQNLTIKILSKLKPVIFREGEEPFTVGEYPDCMYFVSFGTFAFFTEEGIEIGHSDDGTYFGELSILHNAARYVTVVALETSLVYKLSAEDLTEIVKDDKTFLVKLERNAEMKMRKMEQEANIRKRAVENALKKKSFVETAEDEDTQDDED